MRPRLYLNEHLSPRIAEQLRRYDFDVTSTFVLLRRLMRLLNTLSAEELKDKMRWLNEFN